MNKYKIKDTDVVVSLKGFDPWRRKKLEEELSQLREDDKSGYYEYKRIYRAIYDQNKENKERNKGHSIVSTSIGGILASAFLTTLVALNIAVGKGNFTLDSIMMLISVFMASVGTLELKDSIVLNKALRTLQKNEGVFLDIKREEDHQKWLKEKAAQAKEVEEMTKELTEEKKYLEESIKK